MSVPSQGDAVQPVEETAELVYTYDFGGAIVSMTGAVERITGYSREEAARMRLQDLFEKKDLDQLFEDVMDQMGGGAPVPRRLVLSAKDGAKVPIETYSRIVFDQGRPVAVRGMGWSSPGHSLSDDAAGPTLQDRLDRFSRHLKHLHRLNVRSYDSIEEVFDDFLRTGCEIFRVPAGLIHSPSGGSSEIRASVGLPLDFRLDSGVPGTLPRVGGHLTASVVVDESEYGKLTFLCPPDSNRKFTDEEREMCELMGRSLGRVILEQRTRAESGRAARLERERNELLDMIASNVPIETPLGYLLRMIERQNPDVRGAAILFDAGAVSVVVAPSLPRSYVRLATSPGPDLAQILDALQAPRPTSVLDLSSGVNGEKRAIALERLRIKTTLAEPILSASGILLGALLLHYGADQEPKAEDRRLLAMGSRLAAIAVEQRQLAERLAYHAHHDEVTGLPNRTHLVRRLELALQPGGRSIVAVLLLDLDRFKQINDAMGHAAGDELLKRVGERLKEMLGPNDFSARLAADEFAVVFPRISSVDAAMKRAAEFTEAMRRPFAIGDREVFATASIGLSLYPRDGNDVETLLRNADRAMHEAKRHGKNDWRRFARGPHDAAIDNLEVENALRHALENQDLRLHYQPIVTMEGRLDGLEALLGWNHPTLGRISPGIFIPLAEEAGLITQIGNWVLERVCTQNAEWQRRGFEPVRVAVNISALQFARPEFFEAVRNAISLSLMDPKWLELELTEGVVVRDMDASRLSITNLRAMGVRVSIDDFGMGYSSLNYLRQLPLDTLKIDRTFLRDLTKRGGSLPLVQTIVMLAHNLNLQVVAEGVETRQQMELLRAAGCDRMQGHLFGRPAPPEEIESLLSSANRLLAPVE